MELLQKKQEENAEGRSRGGLSTKIHAAVDALGNPVRLLITMGQASEYGQVNTLLKNLNYQYLLADKGYDSDEIIALVTQTDAEPVIPPRSNRKEQRFYDKHIYKERNLVEKLFLKLKSYRRIATRYERLGRNYLAMLHIVASMIWLT